MSDAVTVTGQPRKRLLEQVRDRLRAMHYSYRTEQAYLDWIKRFILFHGKRHPREMGAREIEAFVSYLATGRGVSASTQTQALSAVLYCISTFWRPRSAGSKESAGRKSPKGCPSC